MEPTVILRTQIFPTGIRMPIQTEILRILKTICEQFYRKIESTFVEGQSMRTKLTSQGNCYSSDNITPRTNIINDRKCQIYFILLSSIN